MPRQKGEAFVLVGRPGGGGWGPFLETPEANPKPPEVDNQGKAPECFPDKGKGKHLQRPHNPRGPWLFTVHVLNMTGIQGMMGELGRNVALEI